MVAILYAIWEFLVALAPLLEAFGAALLSIATALWEIAKISAAFTAFFAIIDLLFDPRGKQRVGNLIANIVGGGLSVLTPLIQTLSPTLNSVVTEVVNQWTANGPTLQATFANQFRELANTALTAQLAVIPAGSTSTPGNAVSNAIALFEAAFGFGLSSAGVTAAFEACLPERLNTLNGVGPMLANLAGFAPIAEEVLRPLYKNAAGRSLDYLMRSQYRPEVPPRHEAEQLYARNLITAAELEQLVQYDGLAAAWEGATAAGAFRPIQPRALVSLFQDVPFPTAAVQSALVFAGYRAADIAILLPAMEYASLKDVRHQYLTGEIRACEMGVIEPADLSSELSAQGWSSDAIALVQLTVATRKLLQLTELYRKSISEGYQYGTISDANYVPSLEAIGINEADAEAHYAVDSIKKTGKALVAATRQATALARQRMRAGINAAVASFKSGTSNAEALTAELLLLGVDPAVASYITSIQVFRAEGNLVHIYGVTLPRDRAILLREQVVALGAQVHATLVDPASALTTLAAMGIPSQNAEALVAGWAASKITAADVGVKLPL